MSNHRDRMLANLLELRLELVRPEPLKPAPVPVLMQERSGSPRRTVRTKAARAPRH